ncbi:MAG: hypothetical protein ACLFM7_10305 [Bacteroidales bacterium]
MKDEAFIFMGSTHIFLHRSYRLTENDRKRTHFCRMAVFFLFFGARNVGQADGVD